MTITHIQFMAVLDAGNEWKRLAEQLYNAVIPNYAHTESEHERMDYAEWVYEQAINNNKTPFTLKGDGISVSE